MTEIPVFDSDALRVRRAEEEAGKYKRLFTRAVNAMKLAEPYLRRCPFCGCYQGHSAECDWAKLTAHE